MAVACMLGLSVQSDAATRNLLAYYRRLSELERVVLRPYASVKLLAQWWTEGRLLCGDRIEACPAAFKVTMNFRRLAC